MELRTTINKIENDLITSITYDVFECDSRIMNVTFSVFYQTAIFCESDYCGKSNQLMECIELVIQELKTHGISLVRLKKIQILI